MIGWRAKKGKLRRKLQKTKRSRATQRAAGTPVLRSSGEQAPTAPSQVSAGHKGITDTLPTVHLGASRATSTCPRREAALRSAPGPAGNAGTRQTAHLCRRRHRLPEDRRREQTPFREKKEAQAFLAKTDFIGGAGAASHAPPACLRGPPVPIPWLGRPSRPRGAPGRAHRSPGPEVAAAAATPGSRVRPGPGATAFAAVAPRRAGAARLAATAH